MVAIIRLVIRSSPRHEQKKGTRGRTRPSFQQHDGFSQAGGPYFGGAMIFFAFAIASPYISGRMIGVKVGSPPVNQVRIYISSAICAGVSRFTTMNVSRPVGLP